MLEIYCDGSTSKNGSKDAQGGFGVVVFRDGKIINAYSERSSGTTNNREEMKAIIWAIRNYGVISPSAAFLAPMVYSDSAYCVNTFNDWMYRWERNDWKRAGDKEVENLDLVQQCHRLRKTFNIDLRKIRGHSGILGNELADALATGELDIEEVMKRYG